jgi:hypothetical protein
MKTMAAARNTETIRLIALAHGRLGMGTMKSSAELCLNDAVALLLLGNHKSARLRALKSLAYSVGVFHPDYRAAQAVAS